MDLDQLSLEHQSQINFFRENALRFMAPDKLQTSLEHDWWVGEIIVAFTGGPEGSHWNALVRDLGGTSMQIKARSTVGSSYPAVVAAIGVYVGMIRNLYQLQDQKGAWDFKGINGLGLGSMILENGNRVHFQPIAFGGLATMAEFQGLLVFGKVHAQP